MYQVYLERNAADDLKRLPDTLRARVVGAIRSLQDDPRPHGCRKLQRSLNDWRIRLGDYRILYEIDDSARRVNVMRVKHRREAYR